MSASSICVISEFNETMFNPVYIDGLCMLWTKLFFTVVSHHLHHHGMQCMSMMDIHSKLAFRIH